MLQSGIIDPTKVTRSALENAASIAGLILTTECVISDLPKKSSSGAAAGAWAAADGRHGRYGRHGWHGRYDVIVPALML